MMFARVSVFMMLWSCPGIFVRPSYRSSIRTTPAFTYGPPAETRDLTILSQIASPDPPVHPLGIICSDGNTGYDYYSTAHAYTLNRTQATWWDAAFRCAQNGGNIGTIYDFSTVPDLGFDRYLPSGYREIWIGFRYVSYDGTWSWYDETDVTWENWALSDQNEESLGGCAAASVDYPFSWRRVDCDRNLPFLCQLPTKRKCKFIEYANTSLAAHNYMYLYGKSVADCKKTCVNMKAFVCQSFEHADQDGHQDGRCQFNSGNRWTLSEYFTDHSGWTYYHRTCNSANVVGTFQASDEPSSTVKISPTPSIIDASTSPTFHTTRTQLECSEIVTTRELLLTRDIPVTRVVTVTRSIPVTRDVPVTRDLTFTRSAIITRDLPVTMDIPVTRYVPVTRDVTITREVLVTRTVTEIQATTSPLITPTPTSPDVSPSGETNQPDFELQQLQQSLIQRKKHLTRISLPDKRPSATYVGYVAIAFLTCAFGSIILIDLISLFKQSKKLLKKKNRSTSLTTAFHWNNILKVNGKTVSGTGSIDLANSMDSGSNVVWRHNRACKLKGVLKGYAVTVDESVSITDNDEGTNLHARNNKMLNPHNASRLWRNRHWPVEDSGFADSLSGPASEIVSSGTPSVEAQYDSHGVPSDEITETTEYPDLDAALEAVLCSSRTQSEISESEARELLNSFDDEQNVPKLQKIFINDIHVKDPIPLETNLSDTCPETNQMFPGSTDKHTFETVNKDSEVKTTEVEINIPNTNEVLVNKQFSRITESKDYIDPELDKNAILSGEDFKHSMDQLANDSDVHISDDGKISTRF